MLLLEINNWERVMEILAELLSKILEQLAAATTSEIVGKPKIVLPVEIFQYYNQEINLERGK